MPLLTTEQLDQMEAKSRTFTTEELDAMEARTAEPNVYGGLTPDETYKKAGEVWDAAIDTGAPIQVVEQDLETAKKYSVAKKEIGKIGFVEAAAQDAQYKVPFVGPVIEGMDLAGIKLAYDRLNDPETDWEDIASSRTRQSGMTTTAFGMPVGKSRTYSPTTAQAQDRRLVNTYIDKMVERQERGYTILGRSGQIASVMPGWVAEFAMGGGLYKGASVAVKKGVSRVIKNRIAVGLSAWVVGSAARTAVMPQRIFKATMEKSLQNPDEGWATALAKGIGATWVEAASEVAGGKMLRNLPFAGKYVKQLEKMWQGLSFTGKMPTFIQQMSSKFGYSNMIGEIGEERLATALHAVLGIEDFGAGKDAGPLQRLAAGMKQDFEFENIAAEGLTFAAIGGARFGVGYSGSFFEKDQAPGFGPTIEAAKLIEADLAAEQAEKASQAAPEAEKAPVTPAKAITPPPTPVTAQKEFAAPEAAQTLQDQQVENQLRIHTGPEQAVYVDKKGNKLVVGEIEGSRGLDNVILTPEGEIELVGAQPVDIKRWTKVEPPAAKAVEGKVEYVKGDTVEFTKFYADKPVGATGVLEKVWVNPKTDAQWGRVFFGRNQTGQKLTQSVPLNVVKKVEAVEGKEPVSGMTTKQKGDWLSRIVTKMQEAQVKNLSDAEITRAFKGTVAEDRLINFAKQFRDSGDLKSEDVGAAPAKAEITAPTAVEGPKFKARPGFVDLTPIADAGKQIKTVSEAATKHVVRFGGLTPDVRQVFIEYEEQIRNLPKVISRREDVQEFVKLTQQQEEILQQHREQPKKFPDLPKELAPRLKDLESAIDEYGKRLEALGYSADWPNQYLERLEKKLAKEQAKENPSGQVIENLKAAIKEGKGLEYLHHYYNQTSAGKKIWARFRRAVSKRPSGVLGRKIPTLEKAKELGLEPAPLAVSHAHMIHSIERAEMANDLILAINQNPNLSLPEKDAPSDWVRLDQNIFPASVQRQAWIEEDKPRMKKTFRKYPVPVAEALAEITYSRGNEPLERAYDKLNFALKIIGFYNPVVMTKNDAVQLWRAAGVKGVLPLTLPQIGRGPAGELTINPPKAVQIWKDKGPEYEKLRKGGLFNNIVSYTPLVTEIVNNMVRAARETGGEKAARIVGDILKPLSIVRAVRKFNDISTWNMDEIMRIAAYEAVKDSPMLSEMTDFEKIEWVNDALVNYGKMPKATKRWLGKALFVPTYRVGNFRFFFGEMNRVFKGEWRHVAPVLRTVAYKSFIQYGFPAIIGAAIYYKTGEERDVRTEKGYRIVVHNPETNVDTVYALSDPLLEGAKITQRTWRHTIGLNLAPLPHLLVRAMGGPRRMTSDDPYGEFFKLGTPIYRDIINWKDPNTTVPQKILTQLAIAFAYKRRAREADKQTVVESLAKTLSLWTDWKEQVADLKQMVSGRSYYLGPGGKFGRLLREYDMERDIDRSEVDKQIDDKLMQGNYVDAVKIMIENSRYESEDGISGRILSMKAPIFRYWDSWSGEDRAQFLLWLEENKKYEGKELEELSQALEQAAKPLAERNK